MRQLAEAVGTDDTPARSVKTITREGGGKRKLSNRLTDDQAPELVVAFKAGTTPMELREWRERKACDGVA